MTAVIIEDVWGLPDPIINHAFNLVIPNMPGGGDSRRINVACETTSIPGSGAINIITAKFHGHEVRFAGTIVQEGALSFTITEGVDAKIRRDLTAWVKKGRAIRSQQGALKKDYAVDAYLEILSGVDGDVVYVECLRKAWLKDFNEVELGSGENAVQYTANLVYDINEEVEKVGD